jgi:hypothetical protein
MFCATSAGYSGEEYMHVDLLAPIPAIYLPLRHKVDSTYTDPVCEMSRAELSTGPYSDFTQVIFT